MEQKGRIGAFGARHSINAYGDEDLSWVILRHIMTCFFLFSFPFTVDDTTLRLERCFLDHIDF